MNRARALSALLLVAVFAAPALAQTGFPARYVAGEHYQVLEEAAPTTGEGVEVIEFFLYICPHCKAFEPAFQSWAEQAPEGVTVRQVPVTFGAAGPGYARMFYIAEALGMREAVHADIFHAIHEEQRRLLSRAAMRGFLVEHGADGAAFDAAFDSEEVNAKIAEASALMRAYRVASVPSIGVNGKYWVSPRTAGGPARMLKVVDYLVERSR